ncbi:MAG TPA: hypothetical protein VLV83_04480 [Acidobacteriota bacterium]|nr:hypothetical protein [Acidobacteriota bacterium]
MAIAPGNPEVLYAAGPNGVFKSLDGGREWFPSSQGLTDCRLRDLVLHPESPQVVFVGSQEAGVFKSADGGATWVPSSQGILDLRINDLAVDPSDPDVLYVATRSGVFKSTDAGVSWQDGSQGFLLDFFVQGIAVAPSDPSVLYADTLFDGIYESRTSLLRFALALPAGFGLDDGFVGVALTNLSTVQEQTPHIRELSADGVRLGRHLPGTGHHGHPSLPSEIPKK